MGVPPCVRIHVAFHISMSARTANSNVRGIIAGNVFGNISAVIQEVFALWRNFFHEKLRGILLLLSYSFSPSSSWWSSQSVVIVVVVIVVRNDTLWNYLWKTQFWRNLNSTLITGMSVCRLKESRSQKNKELSRFHTCEIIPVTPRMRFDQHGWKWGHTEKFVYLIHKAVSIANRDLMKWSLLFSVKWTKYYPVTFAALLEPPTTNSINSSVISFHNLIVQSIAYLLMP